jgi:hypothetical protein
MLCLHSMENNFWKIEYIYYFNKQKELPKRKGAADLHCQAAPIFAKFIAGFT